jgi:hypothetical protein
MSNDSIFWLIIIGFGVGGPTIAGVISTLAQNWRKMKESEHLTMLKQSMIERGMSVEEMERVLDAGKPGKKKAIVTEKQPEQIEEHFRAG